MPLAGIGDVGLSFTVANSHVEPTVLSFQIDNPDRPTDVLTFEVSTLIVGSWNHPALWFDYVVEVAGELIDSSELGVGFEGEEVGLDTHTSSFSFTLVGRRWSLFQTAKVFSRGTAVRIWLRRGRADLDAMIESSEPDHTGYVVGCDQDDGIEPVVTVRCRDAASRYDKYSTCEEYQPFTNLTRRGLSVELAGNAGIATVDAPDGARYDKPLQAINKPLFDVLTGLWEPEGGCVRMRGFDTLEIRLPRLKLAPLPADFTWRKGDWVSLRPTPPEDCPSRYVVHGTAAVIVDEVGIETEITTQELRADYSPKQATHYQDNTGLTTPTGLPTLDPARMVVRRLVSEVSRRAGKVLSQITREYRIHNPRHARWVTDTSGPGDVGGGFDYVASYIADGKFVAWPREKLVQTAERRLTNFYSGAHRTLTGTYIEVWGWVLKRMGVRTVGALPTITTVIGAFVYDDDQSYSTLQEAWDRVEAFDISYEYSGDPGPLVETVQDTYRHYSARSRVDGAAAVNRFVTYDGTGQVNLIEPWQRTERKVTSDTITKGLVTGKAEAITTWSAPERSAGVYDWGKGKRSDADSESFGTSVTIETSEFSAINETQSGEEVRPAEGGRRARIYLGSLPSTLYGASIWTDLQMQPVELVVDDSTALEWFGFQRQTLIHEYVQSEAEARMVIDWRRKPRMGPKLEIVRPNDAAVPGSTVRVVDPESGVDQRFIVIRKRYRATGPALMATYLLGDWVAA